MVVIFSTARLLVVDELEVVGVVAIISTTARATPSRPCPLGQCRARSPAHLVRHLALQEVDLGSVSNVKWVASKRRTAADSGCGCVDVPLEVGDALLQRRQVLLVSSFKSTPPWT